MCFCRILACPSAYRRKEMFCLTVHSNIFYLWLFDVRYMVKNHSARKESHLLLLLLFLKL